jgi:hypothetical protein
MDKTRAAKELALHALQAMTSKVESIGTQEENYAVLRNIQKITEALMETVDGDIEGEAKEEEAMTQVLALKILKPVHRRKIKNVFDRDRYADAMFALLPTFEYPDWDHRLVGELVKHFIDHLPAIIFPKAPAMNFPISREEKS